MTADDIYGPETDEERVEAEGHPLLDMLDLDPLEQLIEQWRRLAGS